LVANILFFAELISISTYTWADLLDTAVDPGKSGVIPVGRPGPSWN
jgi:hypothetical protein